MIEALLSFQVNVSLQPTTFQRSDDVTIISNNYKHTFNRNNYEIEDQVSGFYLKSNSVGFITCGLCWLSVIQVPLLVQDKNLYCFGLPANIVHA